MIYNFLINEVMECSTWLLSRLKTLSTCYQTCLSLCFIFLLLCVRNFHYDRTSFRCCAYPCIQLEVLMNTCLHKIKTVKYIPLLYGHLVLIHLIIWSGTFGGNNICKLLIIKSYKLLDRFINSYKLIYRPL